jgi:hypothetical protein
MLLSKDGVPFPRSRQLADKRKPFLRRDEMKMKAFTAEEVDRRLDPQDMALHASIIPQIVWRPSRVVIMGLFSDGETLTCWDDNHACNSHFCYNTATRSEVDHSVGEITYLATSMISFISQLTFVLYV